MDKSQVKPPETEFDNFASLTAKLLAVPKKEIAKKKHLPKQRRKKKTTKPTSDVEAAKNLRAVTVSK